MSTDFKKVIKREYLKCVEDPVYFMRKYCTIQHPQRGKVKFDLYPFQERCLTDFKDNRYNIILKSRQLGISTLSAGFSRHFKYSRFIACFIFSAIYLLICPIPQIGTIIDNIP